MCGLTTVRERESNSGMEEQTSDTLLLRHSWSGFTKQRRRTRRISGYWRRWPMYWIVYRSDSNNRKRTGCMRALWTSSSSPVLRRRHEHMRCVWAACATLEADSIAHRRCTTSRPSPTTSRHESDRGPLTAARRAALHGSSRRCGGRAPTPSLHCRWRRGCRSGRGVWYARRRRGRWR